MTTRSWYIALATALVFNAVLGLAYRVHRLARGGPRADVVGQGVLAVVLGAMAAGVAARLGWVRWAALAYAAVFGVVVMPLWVLGVLIPMRPRLVDLAFTALYWLCLAVIAAAAVAI